MSFGSRPPASSATGPQPPGSLGAYKLSIRCLSKTFQFNRGLTQFFVFPILERVAPLRIVLSINCNLPRPWSHCGAADAMMSYVQHQCRLPIYVQDPRWPGSPDWCPVHVNSFHWVSVLRGSGTAARGWGGWLSEIGRSSNDFGDLRDPPISQ